MRSSSVWKNPRAKIFIIRFLVIFFAFQAVALLGLVHFYQLILAQFIGSWFHLPVNGTLLLLQPTAFEISALCTGITSLGMWFGLLWGFQIPKQKEKWTFAFLGALIILAVNVARVMLIVYFGIYFYLEQVELVHTLSWFAMSAGIVGAWYYAMRKHYHFKSGKEMAHALLR